MKKLAHVNHWLKLTQPLERLVCLIGLKKMQETLQLS